MKFALYWPTLSTYIKLRWSRSIQRRKWWCCPDTTT